MNKLTKAALTVIDRRADQIGGEIVIRQTGDE
jgi:hypothetical protein